MMGLQASGVMYSVECVVLSAQGLGFRGCTVRVEELEQLPHLCLVFGIRVQGTRLRV